MKKLTSLMAILLCVAILCSCAAPSAQTPLERAAAGAHALLDAGSGLLADEDTVRAGSAVFDWLAIALHRAGAQEKYDDYLATLNRYVTDCYAQTGALSDYKATEYHRIALTVLELGGDPTAFGTKPDGSAADLIAEGTYAFSGDLYAQGLNSPIYALIVLDAGGYTVPAGAKYTREALVARILEQQEPDGGFGLVAGTPDVDITAMALQALAPYDEAAEAVDAALTWLSGQMADDCTFSAYGAVSAESISQVLLALAALHIDPETDARFVRGETTLLTALEGFRRDDGSFAHTPDDPEGNLLATGQAMLALAAMS